jgi:nicotinamidase-related amidase
MGINKSERGQSALIVIDVQVDVVAEAFERDAKIAKMVLAVDKSRTQGVPVIWVRHSDKGLTLNTPGWQIVPELLPKSDEAIIEKTFRSTFEATNFEEVLAAKKISHLYICGAETNNCVRHTSMAALERGYDVTLIEDAHTTTGFEWNGYIVDAASTIDEQNTNFMEYALPGRSANTVKAAELWS